MTKEHWEKTTTRAVKEILDGLASSDFVLEYGQHAMRELRKYELDMAVSVWSAWFEEPPTDEEIDRMRELLEA